MKIKLPRLFHRIWALLFGYFWKPCPLCGNYFGGHERSENYIMTSWDGGKIVCKNCGKAADEYNQRWMKENPAPWRSF